MTALNGQRPAPTAKVNKSCFRMQRLRCEDLKEFEGRKDVSRCTKESDLRYVNKNVSKCKKVV